jgi:hypothetical protein
LVSQLVRWRALSAVPSKKTVAVSSLAQQHRPRVHAQQQQRSQWEWSPKASLSKQFRLSDVSLSLPREAARSTSMQEIMDRQKGVISAIEHRGATKMCVHVVWHTRNPMNNWYVNARLDGKLIRCKLTELLDRRPDEVNSGFTKDSWSFEVIDERTFLKLNK